MQLSDKLKQVLLQEFRSGYRGGIYGYTQRALAFNSNKIEGSTLTKEQTASLFEEGYLPVSDEVYRSKDIEEMTGHFLMFKVPGDDRDAKIEYLTQKINSELFPGSALRQLFSEYYFCSFSELDEYAAVMETDLDIFTDQIRKIIPNSAALNKEIKRFKAKCILVSILFFAVYIMLVLPLVLLLF